MSTLDNYNHASTRSRLLAVSLARQCQLLPDDSAGVDTPAGLAGIGLTILEYKQDCTCQKGTGSMAAAILNKLGKNLSKC